MPNYSFIRFEILLTLVNASETLKTMVNGVGALSFSKHK